MTKDSAPGASGMAARVALTGPAACLARAAGDDTVFAHSLVEVVVAAVPASADERRVLDEVRHAADRHDLAFVVADDLELAELLTADGVEIDWSREAYAAARAWAGAERSVGCRVGRSRHRAMEAAEAGADYVHFTFEQGQRGDHRTMIETIEWWAEIFEVPCMAGGHMPPRELADLAAAGADFLAVDAEDPSQVLDLLSAAGAAERGVGP